jgi:hypothetical protein
MHSDDTTEAISLADITASNHPTIIGYILSNGMPRHDTYKCHESSCSRVTFTRLQDLKRHNERSMKSGGHAFPRKDKMIAHLERVHADKMGVGVEANVGLTN